MDLLIDLLPWLVGGGGAGVVGVGGVLLYKADASGWKADLRRISRNIRARINAGKAAKALEISSKKIDESIAADWEAEFQGKPPAGAIKPLTVTGKVVTLSGDPVEDAIAKLRANPRHVIVKKDYEQTHLGPWPRYKCKCGATEREPLAGDSIEECQRIIDRKAKSHVTSMNKAEEVIIRNKAQGKDWAW